MVEKRAFIHAHAVGADGHQLMKEESAMACTGGGCIYVEGCARMVASVSGMGVLR
jgi:hypothetical protein